MNILTTSSPTDPGSSSNSRTSHSQSDGAAGVPQGLGWPQLELAQGTRPRCPAEAIELLTVNAEEETDVVPAENGAEDFIELEEVERVGHGEDADDHRTHVAENGSQNQSLERGVYAHSFRLPAACH